MVLETLQQNIKNSCYFVSYILSSEIFFYMSDGFNALAIITQMNKLNLSEELKGSLIVEYRFQHPPSHS